MRLDYVDEVPEEMTPEQFKHIGNILKQHFKGRTFSHERISTDCSGECWWGGDCLKVYKNEWGK